MFNKWSHYLVDTVLHFTDPFDDRRISFPVLGVLPKDRFPLSALYKTAPD